MAVTGLHRALPTAVSVAAQARAPPTREPASPASGAVAGE